MTNNIQGNSHQAICWFETPQARREWHDIFKVIKGKNLNQEYSTPQDSPSDLIEKSKAFRQAKVKRIQHQQTSFTTNAKGISLGSKHERRKRPTENKSKIIKKMVIGSYISIITLNVNRLNAPTKRQTGWWMKTCTCMHFHLPHHSAWPPKLYVIILYC